MCLPKSVENSIVALAGGASSGNWAFADFVSTGVIAGVWAGEEVGWVCVLVEFVGEGFSPIDTAPAQAEIIRLARIKITKKPFRFIMITVNHYGQ